MTEIGRPTTAHALPGVEGLRLEWSGRTDVGRRRAHNEDSYLAQAPLFVVADGMGGHSAGDVASAAVVDRLHQLVTRDGRPSAGGASDGGSSEAVPPDGAPSDAVSADAVSSDAVSPDDVEEALRLATEDIAVAAEGSDLGAGTTVTGALTQVVDGEPCFTVFNVGDSRVYVLDGGTLTQVTVDHSVVQEMVAAGLLHPDDAEKHPDSNVITRAVGFDPEPRPDWWRFAMRSGMRLLACSDGLTKELSPRHIGALLVATEGADAAARALVDAAVDAGGRDNVTAVVVDVVAVAPATDGEGADGAS